MLNNISDMISFYNFLGSCIYSDPLYPIPTRRIRELKKLRDKVRTRVLSMVAEQCLVDLGRQILVDEAGLNIKER